MGTGVYIYSSLRCYKVSIKSHAICQNLFSGCLNVKGIGDKRQRKLLAILCVVRFYRDIHAIQRFSASDIS